MGDNETRRCVYAVLDFLQEEFNKSTTSSDSKESLEVAMQCLETAFGVNLKDTQYKPKVSLRNAIQEQRGPVLQGASSSTSTTSQAKSQANVVGEPYQVPAEASEDAKNQADQLKNLGNEKMKDGNFEEARVIYDRAIELDGRNAVYFCNRAAAFLKLEQADKALRDCQIAIQLQPNYARAYGRMGVIYSNLGQHAEAAECYRVASQLDPTNESYVNNLKVAEEWVSEGAPGGGEGGGGAAAAAAAAAAGFGGLGGAGGQPPNFQAIFSDPNLINMASQMLQNPNMLNMMRSFMSGFNPQGGGGAGGGGGGNVGGGGGQTEGGGGNPSMDGLLQMGQAIAQQIRDSNPNLAENLSQQLGNQFGNQGGPRNSPHGDGGSGYDL